MRHSNHRRKRSVLVITGSRAEYGYLSPLLHAIRASRSLALRLLVTGMHTLRRYGGTIQNIRDEGIPIAGIIPVREQDSMIRAFGRSLAGIERYCLEHRPDLMLVIGDRGEALAGAIVARHLRIPLAHVSGGDTTGYGVDQPIRQSISKFSNVHFPSTAKSAANLRTIGEEHWRIHISGTLAFDAISHTALPSRAALASVLGLRSDAPWLLVVQHPTPLDPMPLSRQLHPTLKAVGSFNADKIIVYPNTDTGSVEFVREIESVRGIPHTSIHRSLPQKLYFGVLAQVAALIGNSSSGMIEAGYFHIPVINIGGRQKGRECGKNVIHVPYDEKKIVSAIRLALTPSFKRQCARARNPYGTKGASRKIVRVLERISLDERLLYKHTYS